MTLLDLLQTLPQPYDVLHEQALVFGDAPLQALADARAQRPNAQNQASPVALTDGRWMLCADLLTEIGPGGLFADGFQLLDPALFGEVDVIPMTDAVALLPVPDPLEFLGVPDQGRPET
jgi:hypothetical protein